MKRRKAEKEASSHKSFAHKKKPAWWFPDTPQHHKWGDRGPDLIGIKGLVGPTVKMITRGHPPQIPQILSNATRTQHHQLLHTGLNTKPIEVEAASTLSGSVVMILEFWYQLVLNC